VNATPSEQYIIVWPALLAQTIFRQASPGCRHRRQKQRRPTASVAMTARSKQNRSADSRIGQLELWCHRQHVQESRGAMSHYNTQPHQVSLAHEGVDVDACKQLGMQQLPQRVQSRVSPTEVSKQQDASWTTCSRACRIPEVRSSRRQGPYQLCAGAPMDHTLREGMQ
jgi:hypothetical protein